MQSTGCAPIVDAFEAGADHADAVDAPQTVAAGLRVPKAIADFVILDCIRASGGTAVAVDDATLVRDARVLTEQTGVCACPEGGACLAALRRLRESGWVRDGDSVVLFNTGSGLKYAEAFARYPADP